MPDQDTINEARRAFLELANLPGNELVTITLLTETSTGGLGLVDDDAITSSTATTYKGILGPEAAPQVQMGGMGQTTTGRWRLLVQAPSGTGTTDWCRELASYRYNESTNAGTRKVLMLDSEAVDVERVEPDYLFNVAAMTIVRDNLEF